jgi:hypothetical protein
MHVESAERFSQGFLGNLLFSLKALKKDLSVQKAEGSGHGTATIIHLITTRAELIAMAVLFN